MTDKNHYCYNLKSKFTQTDVVCDNNCQGSFSDWGNCSKSCGTGEQNRTYKVDTDAKQGGTTCPFNNGYQETRECNTQACQRDCKLSEWDKTTSNCSNKCGLPKSTLVASRNIKTHPISSGEKCGSLTENVTCEATDPCPINCTGYWSNWTKCDKKCGKGEQTRTYQIPSNFQASNGGTTCPFNNGYQETRSCNTQDCTVDCVGKWSDWSECSGNCGEGKQYRTYKVVTAAANGGKECPFTDEFEEEKECFHSQKCDVEPSNWKNHCNILNYSKILQSRFKDVNCKENCNNDESCLEKCEKEYQIINNTENQKINCKGTWSEWSNCQDKNKNDITCGEGVKTKIYSITEEQKNGGLECPFEKNSIKQETCKMETNCPINCEGKWSEWSNCKDERGYNVTCGGGKQTRKYNINVDSQNGGSECPHKDGDIETQNCNTQACPWTIGEYGECSKKCGGGIKKRTVQCKRGFYLVSEEMCPKPKPLEKEKCNTEACPKWVSGAFGECSKKCGTGEKNKNS